MRRRYLLVLAICAAGSLFFSATAWAEGIPLTNVRGSEPRQGVGGVKPAEKIRDDFAQVELIFQHDTVLPDSNSAIQIKFNLEKDWHFYADSNTAPQRMNLKLTPAGKGLIFSEPVFPKGQLYFDKVTNRNLSVYSGAFSVFIPFKADVNSRTTEVEVTIDGLSCSEQLCRKASYELSKKLDISKSAEMDRPAFLISAEPRHSDGGANQIKPAVVLSLAVAAGLLLNVMPCVWPILPIIVMRLVAQAKQNKAKSIVLGFAFALGIVVFFAALAAVSIILKLGFGIIFQWGDQFRNTGFVIAMSLLMVVLALYMFGLFTFGIPASISGSNKQSGGFAGSVGMGFLAAVLSTPCSFAILTFVLAWAQTQPIPLATITILLIGIGMALPYVILTAIPGLLEKIPKPGRWMELFKHATGFVLLAIGVKLLEAVQPFAPAQGRPEKIIDILYYAVLLAVCVWMWGVWVGYNTPKAKKWLIRLAAIGLAVIFGFIFLTEPEKGLINWQDYDAQLINSAQEANQPVLIKFTADWCFSCKVLDKTVYSSRKIADLIKQKGVLAIKADTTGYDYPAAKALKEIYNEPAVPVTVLLLPGNNTPVKLHGNLIKNELLKNLQGLKNASE
ncbi:MAG: thioredoxin family protein [Phycisphaerae bacterium]|nr:thioredoxin family protein [Phycisphaerae bacterium]